MYPVSCVVCASDKIDKSNRPWHECGEMGRGGVCLNIGSSELELLKRKCFKGSSPRKDCKEDSLRPSLRCKGVLGFVCVLQKDARMTQIEVVNGTLTVRVWNSVSTDDLRDLFTLRMDTISDTLDSLNLDPKTPLSATQVSLWFFLFFSVNRFLSLFCLSWGRLTLTHTRIRRRAEGHANYGRPGKLGSSPKSGHGMVIVLFAYKQIIDCALTILTMDNLPTWVLCSWWMMCCSVHGMILCRLSSARMWRET